ncbi:FAD-binding and (Fe-S)-binding domain-containing protein [Pseudonocardia spinosispora]|uniref:FAD-binding and (Fe-S)-binding domain-containing protein n=1 Tax=Pseudonocardia spinosispora TaxID=103441 RepID=UPI000404FFF3|nr:FAD-binding and (Fe-S)-binding domain-containing protein [Pseudonocardia spinosispora]
MNVGEVLASAVPGVPVEVSVGVRGSYAYDASNYRVAPVAVAFPRGPSDVVELVRACAAASIPITCRGGGTSMAGNAVGPGVVLDFSRDMASVLDLNVAARTARVQPGIVLDDLQRAVAAHGLMFGPDPSSHSRATIGGMIGNDACGNHSVRYGRTAAHVIELELVLADGTQAIAGPGGLRPMHPADERRVEQVDAALREVVHSYLADIRTELGRIPRQVSGYQLHHLLPENGVDLAKCLVGTEGTCAVVVAATIALQPVPPAALLVALGYDDVVDAARDVPEVLEFSPAAVEGMDDSIVDTMRGRRGPDSVRGLPGGKAWLFVDLDGDDPESVAARAEELLGRVRGLGRLREGRVVADPAERASLWRVREDGAGLATRPLSAVPTNLHRPSTSQLPAGRTGERPKYARYEGRSPARPAEIWNADHPANAHGHRTTGAQTWAGWEDAAVDPLTLPDYLYDFRELLAEHGRRGVLYGHFGAGCVHVRIDFDLATEAGVEDMRAFVTDAARLVVKHGGTLSGEHGDGRARGELLEIMYSPRVIAAFAALKAAFDPDDLLNPGIIIEPRPLDADLAPLRGGTPLPMPTALRYAHDPGGFGEAAARCVGIGRCRSDVGGVMCPSFRATHREQDSTRGRARALQEMLRGDLDTGGWKSPDVAEALDLCLSCRACSSDCPVGVDMASYKAEFLHQHYKGRLRPRSHYSLGWLPLAAALAGWVPWLANAVLRRPRLRRLMTAAGGVTPHRDLPRFAGRRRARRGLPAAGGPADAVLFTDTFTRAFRPELLGAAARVLRRAGTETAPIQGACCGLTWISTGQLSVAKKVLTRTARILDRTGDGPIVVLEPSCAAALRTDLPELVAGEQARRVAARVRTFAEMISERLDQGWRPPALPAELALQTHCHEYAVFGAATQRRVLQRLGVTTVDEAVGCCGLAGNFGFEEQHYDTSMAVAELSLTKVLAGEPARTAVLADGFSCQTQIAHLTDNPAQHLAQLLDNPGSQE